MKTPTSMLKKAPPSVAEFRAAVKYVLTHLKGMPELVAEAVMDMDAPFMESKRLKCSNGDDDVLCVAEELATEPPGGAQWVQLEEGERVTRAGQLVIDIDGPLAKYLDAFVDIGLHGDSRDAVARAMMARGIEGAFFLLPAMMKKK